MNRPMHPLTQGFIDQLMLLHEIEAIEFLGLNGELPMVAAACHIIGFDLSGWDVFPNAIDDIFGLHEDLQVR